MAYSIEKWVLQFSFSIMDAAQEIKYTLNCCELIDEIYEEINTNTPVDFTEGSSGIRWELIILLKTNLLLLIKTIGVNSILNP